MAIEIRELHRDELTPSTLAAVTRLANIVDPEHLPGDAPMRVEMVYDLMSPGGRFYVLRFWAMFDTDTDAVVALAEAQGSTRFDNTDLREIAIAVDPGMRRRGLGTELFEHVKEVLAHGGITKLWGWGPLDDEGRGFWRNAAGLTLGYDERISRCVLADVDEALMESWIAGAEDRAEGYHLERWEGACPDHLIERLALARQAMNDAPMDDLDFEDETYDVGRARDVEAIHASRGRVDYVIMAIDTASGELAGYTSILVPRARPQISYQGDTVTLAAHRNRGIGRWMKAEMWKWIRSERPDVTSLDTGNAESNAAMLSINVAMGFRGYVNLGMWHTGS